MPIPRDAAAKAYYFAAVQRRQDAAILFDASRTAGAVYMGGYCVECGLKALVITETPARQRPEIQPQLITHSFAVLRHIYQHRCGGSFPRDVTRELSVLDTWSSERRYDVRNVRRGDARRFLDAVDRVWAWIDPRV